MDAKKFIKRKIKLDDSNAFFPPLQTWNLLSDVFLLYIPVTGLDGHKNRLSCGTHEVIDTHPKLDKIGTPLYPSPPVLWYLWNFTQRTVKARSMLFSLGSFLGTQHHFSGAIFHASRLPNLFCTFQEEQLGCSHQMPPATWTPGWILSKLWLMNHEPGNKWLCILICFFKEKFSLCLLGKNPFKFYMKCHAEPWRHVPKTEWYCFLFSLY